MAAPDEREFITFDRGEVRDAILLAAFRNSLRNLINPETGTNFTEDEIQRATQPGSRFYLEADAIDILTQSLQQRGLYLSDQIDPRRASTSMLDNHHGRIWLGANSRLDATGASGTVRAKGTVGTVFVGSATVPDPAAHVATDPNGQRFQVLVTETVGSDGTATLTLKGVDTGKATNIPIGTVLTWTAPPLGANPEASVIATPGTGAGFVGGFDRETDQEYALRIEERIREKPASGNAAHFRAWAKDATNAVETAFVYSVALHAGSVVVAPTQRRSGTGPLARIPTAATLIEVGQYLTAPNSPEVPQRVFVLVTSIQSQSADLVLRLSMGEGISGGWADVNPWPAPTPPLTNPSGIEQVKVDTIPTPDTVFTVETESLLPGQTSGAPLTLSGLDAPKLMLWDDVTSRWERLDVASVQHDGATTATITLNVAPSKTPALSIGDRLSPYTDRLTTIAEALEAFFDGLGPGEVVKEGDVRFSRAARDPRPAVRYPTTAGQLIVSNLIDSLGGIASNAELSYISRNEPDLPADISDGPNMITLGKVNIYPL